MPSGLNAPTLNNVTYHAEIASDAICSCNLSLGGSQPPKLLMLANHGQADDLVCLLLYKHARNCQRQSKLSTGI